MAILIGINDDNSPIPTTTWVKVIMTGSMEEIQSFCKDCLENKEEYEARLKEIKKKLNFFKKSARKISFWDYIFSYTDKEDLPELNEIEKKLRIFEFDKVIAVEGEVIL